MKRDARIGLAVVLVLGLMVTLLVGRAIYNSNDQSAEMDGSLPALEGAAPHSDAVQTPAAANSDINGNTAAPMPSSGDALNRFVDDQTRNLGPTSAAPAPVPTGVTPTGRAPMIEEPVASANPRMQPLPTGGDRTPAPQPQPQPHPLNPDLLDHEAQMVSNTPTENTSSEGLGYTVQAGDNIWKISAKVYGDGKFSQKIADANKDVNAQKLKPGMVLKIPALPNKTVLAKLPSYAEAKAGKTTPATVQPDAGQPVAAARGVKIPVDHTGIPSTETQPVAGTGTEQKHTVAAGESLSAIAQKYYGASGPKSVGRILAANKGLDASKLKVGQELTIPAK
jgi:nucleoid-associated protein YgaU